MLKNRLHALAPGLLLTISLTACAYIVARVISMPVMLVALLLGMAFSALTEKTHFKAGINWAAVLILQAGIVLLGFGISFAEISILGWRTVCIVLLSMTAVIAFGAAAGRLKPVGQNLGILSGVATSICGASAALAISALLPDNKQKENDLLLVIITTTILSSLAMIIYPYICSYFGFDMYDAGIFLGATIHNVPQAVGAGYILSPEAGEIATLTKMIRVSFLLPVMVVFMMIFKRNGTPQARRLKPPAFLILFLMVIAFNNAMNMPELLVMNATAAAKILLLIAITAIGLKSAPRYLFKSSATVLALVLIETLLLAGLILFLLMMAS